MPPWEAPRRNRAPLPEDAESEGWSPNAKFPLALALLRADVLALCLLMGLPAQSLWPPEALLLNLVLIRDTCSSRAGASGEGGGSDGGRAVEGDELSTHLEGTRPLTQRYAPQTLPHRPIARRPARPTPAGGSSKSSSSSSNNNPSTGVCPMSPDNQNVIEKDEGWDFCVDNEVSSP